MKICLNSEIWGIQIWREKRVNLYKVRATQIGYYQFSPAANKCVLQTLCSRVFPYYFLSVIDVTKAKYFLQEFLKIKQTSDMEFPIIHVYKSLWMNSLICIWIWIIHSITCIVSLWVVSGDVFLVPQSTGIRIVPSMTLHVSLLVVPGDESFTTLSTLI